MLGGSIGRVVSGRRCCLEGRLEAGFALSPPFYRQASSIFSVRVTNLGGPFSSLTCAQGSQLTV